MNNIGIYDILYCSNLSYTQRINIYKKCGFKEFALYLDNSYMQEGEQYIDVLNYAKKVGLQVNQVHLSYNIADYIFDDSTTLFFDYLNKKAKECKKLGIKYMVVHASKGDFPPIISNEQLNKIKEVANKNKDVFFCFENIRNNTNLEKILALSLPNIKMCFDLGHAHAYSNELELLEKHKKNIVCSHLHNNFGSDEHLPLYEGEICYKPLVKQLVAIKDCSNCLECFPPKGKKINEKEFESFVENCFDSTQF